jgi:hypothetical protein
MKRLNPAGSQLKIQFAPYWAVIPKKNENAQENSERVLPDAIIVIQAVDPQMSFSLAIDMPASTEYAPDPQIRDRVVSGPTPSLGFHDEISQGAPSLDLSDSIKLI